MCGPGIQKICKSALVAAAYTICGILPLTAQSLASQLEVDADDIGGVVTSSAGPEAGVWVIAETTDLSTRFIKSVVTDDQGRYVIPDLPVANYKVWVRGYGLVDSPKMRAKPGQNLDHTAIPASNDAAAAHYYPALYWYTMMQLPPAEAFGGSTDIPENITRDKWRLRFNHTDCISCHQLGNEATRTVPAQLGAFETGEDAWMRRTQSGQFGDSMTRRLAGELGGVPYQYLGDWTDRIAAGELPGHKPPRPSGLERNIVISSWEWSTPDKYLHDAISTDKRDPTVNAYGKIYGSPEYSTDMIPVLDPKTNTVTSILGEVRDLDMPLSLGAGHAGQLEPTMPSAYWGDRQLWDTRFNNHNPMFDEKGQVWFAAAIRGRENPDWCKEGSNNPYAKVFPLDKSSRQVAVYNQETEKFDQIDTCFTTHHLQFGYDDDNTLWFSGSGQVASWLKTKTFEETHDSEASIGWAPFVLDYNGNGKLDEFTEPGKPEAGKDMRFNPGSGAYAVMVNPADGSIWYTSGVYGGTPGFLRFDPVTKLSEFFAVPKEAISMRGGDISSEGVVYGSGAAGQLVEFDRRKCTNPLSGPNATGTHCPEGFAMHRYPGPGFDDTDGASAEASYFTWVDQHDVAGFGKDVPISTANLQDGFVAFVDGKMVMIQVPYPMGFFAKNIDGRIDDPNGGWKGRGLWTTSGDRTPWLGERGKGASPLAVHIQVRPDPLAH